MAQQAMAAQQHMKRQQVNAQVGPTRRTPGPRPVRAAAAPPPPPPPPHHPALPPPQNHHVQQQQQALAAQQQSANQEERAYVAQLQEVINNQASALQQQVVESANSKGGSPAPAGQPGPEFGAEGKAADVDGIGADAGAPKGRVRDVQGRPRLRTNYVRTDYVRTN